ncbi:hypothetical protein DFH06DRAFT_1462784 [Mycena polygramma]|nr:hypothetical protein DFH06DRAFT_1462784 [Mycena polygramma]
MVLDTLSLRGIDAYLQDPKGKRFPLGKPKVNGNMITAAIEVENPRSYSMEWCTSMNARAISAWCEVFRSGGRAGHIKVVQIANHYMAENEPQTQSRSSRGRLEHPTLHRDAWLWTPPSKPGFVTLEIRRLRKPPSETKRPNNQPGSVLLKTDVDMLDDDSEGAGKPPYIIFRFEFKPKHISDGEAGSSPSSSLRSRRRTIRRSPLKRSKAPVREMSSDLSDELSSASEPEGPPLSILAKKQKNVHGAKEDAGATLANDNGRSPPAARAAKRAAPAAEGDVDLILRKRKLIIQRQEEIKEEKRLKRVKREKLVQDLWEDT